MWLVLAGITRPLEIVTQHDEKEHELPFLVPGGECGLHLDTSAPSQTFVLFTTPQLSQGQLCPPTSHAPWFGGLVWLLP